jgi:hypothetical protein
MLLSLPVNLYPDVFQGSVLTGRLVCKQIRDGLWNAGSEAMPLFFRPISQEYWEYKIELLRKFSHARVLVPFESKSIAGKYLIKKSRSLQLKTEQELTLSDVKRAKGKSILSMINKLMYRNTPLPSDQVLHEILHVIYVMMDRDEGFLEFENSDVLQGEGLEIFACRCLKHSILARRSPQLISLGLKVLWLYLQADMDLRE